jgi:hypothetical protein
MLVRLVPKQPDKPGSFRDVPRGEHRNRVRTQWPGLWPRLKWPETQRAIYLWRDGRFLLVESYDDYDLYHDADAVIAGGYQWIGEDTDWIASVLVANGFTVDGYVQDGPYLATYSDTY